jgi:hypothetical protein
MSFPNNQSLILFFEVIVHYTQIYLNVSSKAGSMFSLPAISYSNLNVYPPKKQTTCILLQVVGYQLWPQLDSNRTDHITKLRWSFVGRVQTAALIYR